MNIRKNTVSRLLAAVGVTAVVVVGAVTPSLAESNDGGPFNYRIFDNNDTAWAYRPGYTDKATVEQSTHEARAKARAQNGRYIAHGAPEDLPGFAFPSFGHN